MGTLLQAIRPLVMDLFGSIVFAVLLALKIPPATAAVIAGLTTIAMIAFNLIAKRPVPGLQWFSLASVLVFGTATFFTHDPRFLMTKPTLIYLALAAVMLKRGWLLRYLPPKADGKIDDITIGFGYVWSGLMAVTAVLNFVIAFWFHQHWLAFLAVFPTVSKLGLFALQYGLSFQIARRRILAMQAKELESKAEPESKVRSSA